MIHCKCGKQMQLWSENERLGTQTWVCECGKAKEVKVEPKKKREAE